MRKKERVRPMPTEEEKAKARLKAASADPLVWAMKAVDEKFPDTRAKDAETLQAEAAITEPIVTEVENPAGEAPEVTLTSSQGAQSETSLESLNSTTKSSLSAATAIPEHPSASSELKTESQTTVPMTDGVVTMQVTPMRQDVSKVNHEKEKKSVIKAVKSTKVPEKPADKGAVAKVKMKTADSQQKKFMVAFAALLLLALGGMTFGIVAMIKQGQVTEELVAKIATGGVSTDADVAENSIYLKDWDMKIKIADGLTNISYDYEVEDYASVMIWGVKKTSGANYTPDFAKQSKNASAMGTVVRVPRYERSAAGRLIWYDDYYNYYYQGPDGEPDATESEMSWWVESYLLIKEMLTNADNYVKVDDATVSQN